MSGYSADTQILATASQDILDTKVDIDALLSALNSEVDMIGNSWKGGASQQFQAMSKKFDQDVIKLSGALQAIGDELGGTVQTMNTQEEDQSAGFGSIGQLLNGG